MTSFKTKKKLKFLGLDKLKWIRRLEMAAATGVQVTTQNRFDGLSDDVPEPESQIEVLRGKRKEPENRSPPTTAAKKKGNTNSDSLPNPSVNSSANTEETPSMDTLVDEPPAKNIPDPQYKWHIVVHASKNELIDTCRLDSVIQKVCPSVIIVSSMRSRSKQSVFYKTATPLADFNSLFKHRVSICQEMRMTLTFDPWKLTAPSTKSMELEPKHVVVRDVPLDYTVEEIKRRLDPQILSNVESMGRIKSSKSGNPVPMIRLVCASEDFAKSLISNGLLLGNRKLNVEAAKPRFNPLRCFNCSRFGHHSQECTYKLSCSICGYEHRTDECPNKQDRRQFYCINCDSTTHRARDRHCPLFIKEAGKLRRQNETKNKKLLCNAGIVPPTRETNPGLSWTSVVTGQHVPPADEINQQLTEVKQSVTSNMNVTNSKLEELQQNITVTCQKMTAELRLEVDSKYKKLSDELKLEIQMNRSGSQTLLETNKTSLEMLFANFTTTIEAQVRGLMTEFMATMTGTIHQMIAKQQAESMEQTSRIVYHQTKNALVSQGRAQSLPRLATSTGNSPVPQNLSPVITAPGPTNIAAPEQLQLHEPNRIHKVQKAKQQATKPRPGKLGTL